MNIALNIPEDFFKEEEKCGYVITTELKKLWAVDLDMLNEFDKVCSSNGLRYYIAYGTLLGAIRHGGFIPWDDDVDLVMPRDDYERLCAIAENNFKEPYFFQTEKTDPGFSRPFARLRNSETAAFQKSEDYRKIPYNQGIFIDIFPLDNFPDKEAEQICFIKKLSRAKRKMIRFSRFTTRYRSKETHTLSGNIKNVIKGCSSCLTRPVMRMLRLGNPFVAPYEKLEQRYHEVETDAWFVPFFFNDKRQIIWEKKWFEKTIQVDFEMMKVPAPADYEKILSTCYGNWREPVMGSTIHGEVFYDAEHSFRDYLSDIRQVS